VCGAQIFPTLQEPLQNMRVNRAKFAAMAQSSMDVAALAIPAYVVRTMTPAASSTRSSSSDGADTEGATTGSKLEGLVPRVQQAAAGIAW
jgi:hypothetical protein